MGWAEKLPSGRYRAVYRDVEGKRRSAGVYTHKPAAKRAANAAEEAARAAPPAAEGGVGLTWGSWCEAWWPTRAVEPSTLRRDLRRRKRHLDDQWGTTPISDITRQDVRAWAAALRDKGLAAESVRRCVHLLSASLTAAVESNLIPGNPAARLKLPSGPKDLERYLTAEDYEAILDAMPTTEDRLIFRTLCLTGMRWGELAGLHRARVDLERRVLRVVETYDDGEGKIKGYPKGRQSRDVPLGPELVAAFAAEVGAADPESCGVEHVTGRCRSPLVFTTPSGKPLRHSNWSRRVWAPAVEVAGVGHVRIHDCRHTYASWLLQGGVKLPELSRLLGHASVVTTERYAHLAETPADAVLEALARGSAPQLPHVCPTPTPIAPTKAQFQA